MLTALVALTLAQARFTVLPAGAPWSAPAPLESVKVLETLRVVWDGTTWLVVFADARRGFDAADAGRDLWLTQWAGTSGNATRTVLVTQEPQALSVVHLERGAVSSGDQRVVAVRQVEGPTGTTFVANTWRTAPTTHVAVPDRVLLPAGPATASALAASGSTWMVAFRPAPGTLRTVTFDPDMPSFVAANTTSMLPGAAPLSLAPLDGGFLVASPAPTGVSVARLTTSGLSTLVPGPTLPMGVTAAVLVPFPQDVALMTRSNDVIAASWLNTPGFGAPAQTVGPSIGGTRLAGCAFGQTLVAGWPNVGTVLYRAIDRTDAGQPNTTSLVGAPTSMATDGTSVVATELRQTSLTLQRLDLMAAVNGLPRVVRTVSTTLQARAPQRNPSVAWNDARREFLVVWDQRRPDGGWQPLQAHLAAALSPSPIVNGVGSPGDSDLRLARRADGGLVALVLGTSTPYVVPFDPAAGLQGAVQSAAGADAIVGGERNVLTWSTEMTPDYQVPGFPAQPGGVGAPTCMPFLGGDFWSLTTSPGLQGTSQYQLSRISEFTGVLSTVTAFSGARGRGVRICLAHSDAVTLDGGAALLAAEASNGTAVLTLFPVGHQAAPTPFVPAIADVGSNGSGSAAEQGGLAEEGKAAQDVEDEREKEAGDD